MQERCQGSLHPSLDGEGLFQQLGTFPWPVPLPCNQMFLPSPPGEVRAGASSPRPRRDSHCLPAPLLLPCTWTVAGDEGQLMASSHVAGSQRSPVSTCLASLRLQQHPNGAGGAEPSLACLLPSVRGNVLGLGLQHQGFEVWGVLECLGGMLEYLGGMLEHLGRCWSIGGDTGVLGRMLGHLGRCWSIWGNAGAFRVGFWSIAGCWSIWGLLEYLGGCWSTWREVLER